MRRSTARVSSRRNWPGKRRQAVAYRAPWLARERRVVPDEVERALRAVERAEP